MMGIWFKVSLLGLLTWVSGQTTSSSVTATTCDWSATGTEVAQSTITDLRVAKPFSYQDTIYLTSCGLDVQTVTMWLTADVRGTKYPAPSIIGIFSNQGSYIESYQFPGLTSTALKPGDAITMSWSNLYTSGTTTSNIWGGSGYFSIFVPATAIAFNAASTTSPTTTTPTAAGAGSVTPTDASSGTAAGITVSPSSSTPVSGTDSGSSTPIGAIVGGAVGGVVALGALVAIVLLKTRKPAPRKLTVPIGDDYSSSSIAQQPEPKPDDGFEQEGDIRGGGNGATYPRIRYPAEEETVQVASGRTNDGY